MGNKTTKYSIEDLKSLAANLVNAHTNSDISRALKVIDIFENELALLKSELPEPDHEMTSEIEITPQQFKAISPIVSHVKTLHEVGHALTRATISVNRQIPIDRQMIMAVVAQIAELRDLRNEHRSAVFGQKGGNPDQYNEDLFAATVINLKDNHQATWIALAKIFPRNRDEVDEDGTWFDSDEASDSPILLGSFRRGDRGKGVSLSTFKTKYYAKAKKQ